MAPEGQRRELGALQADGRTLGRNFNYRKLDWTDRDVQLNLTVTHRQGCATTC